jgi:transcriptional regulator with XRE-family HTH domain
METGMTAFGEDEARAFGQLLRERRKALGLRQEDVVLATGVGRRYLIELEAGKPTARLGPALMIARQLGISFHPFDQSQADQSHRGIDDLGLPPLADLPPLKD